MAADVVFNLNESPFPVTTDGKKAFRLVQKYGDQKVFRVCFTDEEGDFADVPAGTFQLEVKQVGEYCEEPLLRVVDFTKVTEEDGCQFLEFSLTLEHEDLLEMLCPGKKCVAKGSSRKVPKKLDLMGEFAYRDENGLVCSSKTFDVCIENDINKSFNAVAIPLAEQVICTSLIPKYDGPELLGFVGGSLNAVIAWLFSLIPTKENVPIPQGSDSVDLAAAGFTEVCSAIVQKTDDAHSDVFFTTLSAAGLVANLSATADDGDYILVVQGKK